MLIPPGTSLPEEGESTGDKVDEREWGEKGEKGGKWNGEGRERAKRREEL